MKESDDNIGFVCAEHAPKPGQFTGQDPQSFVGKYIKMAFAAINPVSGADTKEHMWVKVLEVGPLGILHGRLDNNPIFDLKREFQSGDELDFRVEDIEEVEAPSSQASN